MAVEGAERAAYASVGSGMPHLREGGGRRGVTAVTAARPQRGGIRALGPHKARTVNVGDAVEADHLHVRAAGPRDAGDEDGLARVLSSAQKGRCVEFAGHGEKHADGVGPGKVRGRHHVLAGARGGRSNGGGVHAPKQHVHALAQRPLCGDERHGLVSGSLDGLAHTASRGSLRKGANSLAGSPPPGRPTRDARGLGSE